MNLSKIEDLPGSMSMLTDPCARHCGRALISCQFFGRSRPRSGMRSSQLAGTDASFDPNVSSLTWSAPPCAAIGTGIGLIQVRTIFIAAPQQGQGTGGRGLIAVNAVIGVNLSSRCSSVIRRLQFGCGKRKLRARRSPFGRTCCNTSQLNCAPVTVRSSTFPVFAFLNRKLTF